MAGKKTGVILLKANGKTFECMPGVKVNFGGMTRTEIIANGGVAGFYETPVASMVSCTIPHDADTNIDEVRDMKNAVIVVNPDAGASYQINGAFNTNALELSDAGGGIAVEFKGPKATKL
jgi:hypothetical protein